VGSLKADSGLVTECSIMKSASNFDNKHTVGGGRLSSREKAPDRLSTPLLLTNFTTGVEASTGTLKGNQAGVTVCCF